MASSQTVLPSASRTATFTSADIPTAGFKHLTATLDMTAVGAGPSVTLTINAKDVASGKYRLLLAGAAVTTVSTNVYKVTQAIVAAAANAAAVDVLPEFIQVVVTANNGNAGTYSLGLDLI